MILGTACVAVDHLISEVKMKISAIWTVQSRRMSKNSETSITTRLTPGSIKLMIAETYCHWLQISFEKS